MDEPKPCPFCGEDDIEVGPTRFGPGGPITWVGCNGCGARVFDFTDDCSTALDIWNRRAPQEKDDG